MTFRTTTMLFFVLGRAFLFLIDTQHCFRLNNLPRGLALSSSPASPHYVYRESVCITRTRKFSAQSLPFPHRIGSILWCRHGRWRSFTFRELSGPSGRQAGKHSQLDSARPRPGRDFSGRGGRLIMYTVNPRTTRRRQLYLIPGSIKKGKKQEARPTAKSRELLPSSRGSVRLPICTFFRLLLRDSTVGQSVSQGELYARVRV